MSMVSLNPGPIFSTPGFNQTHTPVGPGASQEQIKETFKGEEYNGRYDWPPDSPVAEVYDIKNTPTKMVLLNNRIKPKSASHLRGQTDRVDCRATTPNPGRHTPDMYPKKNPDRHLACSDSISPRFARNTKMDDNWVKENSRSRKISQEESPASSDGRDRRVARHSSRGQSDDRHRRGSGRATSAHTGVSVSPAYFTPPKSAPPKKQRRAPISVNDNAGLVQSMNKGNRAYFYSIAQVYDMSKEREYKQHQYKALVLKEVLRGFHTVEECRKYLRYIDGPRQRPYGATDPARKSAAASPRSSNDEKRSKTPQGQKKQRDQKHKSKSRDVDEETATKDSRRSSMNSVSKGKTDAEKAENNAENDKHHSADERRQSGNNGIRVEVQVGGKKSTKRSCKTSGKDDKEKVKHKEKASDHSEKSRNTHGEKTKNKTETKNKTPQEKAKTDKARVKSQLRQSYPRPISNMETNNDQQEETPNENSENQEIQIQIQMKSEAIEKETQFEDIQDKEKGNTSEDESESDTSVLHLQGPEGTIRPKSRLGNRDPAGNELKGTSQKGFGDASLHGEADIDMSTESRSEVKTINKQEPQHDESLNMDEPKYKSNLAGSASLDQELNNKHSVKLEVHPPRAEQPQPDTWHTKQRESGVNVAITATAKHRHSDSDSDDDTNGNSMRPQIDEGKKDYESPQIIVKDEPRESVSNLTVRPPNEVEPALHASLTAERNTEQDADINGNDPTPSDQGIEHEHTKTVVEILDKEDTVAPESDVQLELTNPSPPLASYEERISVKSLDSVQKEDINISDSEFCIQDKEISAVGNIELDKIHVDNDETNRVKISTPEPLMTAEALDIHKGDTGSISSNEIKLDPVPLHVEHKQDHNTDLRMHAGVETPELESPRTDYEKSNINNIDTEDEIVVLMRPRMEIKADTNDVTRIQTDLSTPDTNVNSPRLDCIKPAVNENRRASFEMTDATGVQYKDDNNADINMDVETPISPIYPVLIKPEDRKTVHTAHVDKAESDMDTGAHVDVSLNTNLDSPRLGIKTDVHEKDAYSPEIDPQTTEVESKDMGHVDNSAEIKLDPTPLHVESKHEHTTDIEMHAEVETQELKSPNGDCVAPTTNTTDIEDKLAGLRRFRFKSIRTDVSTPDTTSDVEVTTLERKPDSPRIPHMNSDAQETNQDVGIVIDPRLRSKYDDNGSDTGIHFDISPPDSPRVHYGKDVHVKHPDDPNSPHVDNSKHINGETDINVEAPSLETNLDSAKVDDYPSMKNSSFDPSYSELESHEQEFQGAASGSGVGDMEDKTTIAHETPLSDGKLTLYMKEAHSSNISYAPNYDQESDSDSDHYTLRGPEGTTRPKSRLGKRPLTHKEPAKDVSSQSTADANIRPPTEPLFEGEYITLEAGCINQSGDHVATETSQAELSSDMHIVDHGVLVDDSGNRLTENSEPVSVTADEGLPHDELQKEVFIQDDYTLEAPPEVTYPTHTTTHEVDAINVGESSGGNNKTSVEADIATEHELASGGHGINNQKVEVPDVPRKNSLSLLRTVLDSDRNDTPDSVHYESETSRNIDRSPDINIDNQDNIHDSSLNNQHSPGMTDGVPNVSTAVITHQEHGHTRIHSPGQTADINSSFTPVTRKLSTSSSHSSKSTESDDLHRRAGLFV